jgi:hypothetical protein
MPQLASVHGRCPRCSQVLTLPAGQLESVFRCARCQYRVSGALLIEEAKASPPEAERNHLAQNHLAASGASLPRFEENSDDQRTRVLMPGGADDESEIPLPALFVEGPTSNPPPALRRSSPPRPPALPSNASAPRALQRFEAASGDADDQTRLHLPGALQIPAARDTTLVGVPAPALLGNLERVSDADDQQTRLHLPDQIAARPRMLASAGRTLMGVPPAADGLGLVRFEQAAEDSDEQRTRLHVPIAYEDEDAVVDRAVAERAEQALAGRAMPELRPLVAPVASDVRALTFDAEAYAPRGLGDQFGRATLQLARSLDDWLHERRITLLATLATLSGLIGPGIDAILRGPLHGGTVITSNLVLFFFWTLAFAWVGKLRNDEGAWDPRIAWTRLATATRLGLEDLGQIDGLPSALKYRVTSEFAQALGLLGLGVASVLTISHLVWAWPAGAPALLTGRVWGSALVAIAIIARRRAESVPPTLVAPEIAAPAVSQFPAVVDLSLPLNLDVTAGPTPLHQLLEVLSEWPPRTWPNQDSYLLALERHLLRRMGWARIERERWFGSERSDGVAHLLMNESLLVEVAHGFDANAADRISARMRSLAKVWRGKPAVIVIFEASRAALLGGPGTAALEALHRSYPMLAVRMPAERASLI